MDTESKDQGEDSERRQSELDKRYGKIGISAVAGAVCHQGEPRRAKRRSSTTTYDRD